MDIQKVLNTTKDFYKNISSEFSNTRQYSWKGWNKVIEVLNLKTDISVLDIGCGNGRFYDYLKNNLTINFKYMGIDADANLLNIAKDKYPEGIFKKLDIFNDINQETDKYDLVVGFGITHHIPGKDFRIKWFESITELVSEKGYLVLSFWNFLDKKTLIKAEELEENDYWLGWNTKEIKRYCHYYDQEEINEINNLLYKKGLTLEKEITDTEDLNKYMVYRYN